MASNQNTAIEKYKKSDSIKVRTEKMIDSDAYKQATSEAGFIAGSAILVSRLLARASWRLRWITPTLVVFLAFKDDMGTIVRMLRAYYDGRYRNISNATLLKLLTAVIYFVSPIHLLIDFIPVIGLLDDAIIIGWVIRSVREKMWMLSSNGRLTTWFMIMPKKTVQSSYITIDDRRVNLYIHTEMRGSSRVSIGRKGVTIRLPKMLPSHLKEQHVQSFTQWAIDQIRKKPELLPTSIDRIYRDGYSFTLQGKTFTLFFGISKNKTTITAKLLNSVIYFSIPENSTEERLQKAIPALISRLIAKQYYGFLHTKLLELNKLYFDKEIKNFRLKYTHSVWGSCSRHGNINISTRLLFAPDEVIDYVLIHELAHLIHPNHSSRFWNEVARIMPDYKQYDKWLNKNANQCDF